MVVNMQSAGISSRVVFTSMRSGCSIGCHMEPGHVLFLLETPEPRQLHHSRLYGAGGVRIRAGQLARTTI